MELETAVYVSVGVLGGACFVLGIVAAVLCTQVGSLRRALRELQANKLRVQKLKLEPDKNHAFHNPTISPDEELSKRGYSMYVANEADVESGRGSERQKGGQLLDELSREIDSRQNRQSTAPPFLLQAIEENKRKTRSLGNPAVSRGRASDTNPNFIY